jgi:hypothetical protein
VILVRGKCGFRTRNGSTSFTSASRSSSSSSIAWSTAIAMTAFETDAMLNACPVVTVDVLGDVLSGHRWR